MQIRLLEGAQLQDRYDRPRLDDASQAPQPRRLGRPRDDARFAIAKAHWIPDSSWLAADSDGWQIGQEDEEFETEEVAPEQIEKYVKVYTAMQRDRTLTVDEATAREHLSVAAFRDIESKVERDGVLRDRVRRELLKEAEDKTRALKLRPQGATSSPAP